MTVADATTLHELIRYVDTPEADWEPLEEGAWVRTLHRDAETRQRVLMVRWEPGYTLSFRDEHRHDELVYILEGTFVDQHRASGPGTFIHNEPGSWHQPHTPDGCTFLAFITPRPTRSSDTP